MTVYGVEPATAYKAFENEPPRDFSQRPEPVRFIVDDDLFEAVSELPALDTIMVSELLQEFESDDATGRARFEIVCKLMEIMLLPESSTRFIERLSSRERPVGFNRMFAIVSWLMTQYTVANDESSEVDSHVSDELDGES